MSPYLSDFSAKGTCTAAPASNTLAEFDRKELSYRRAPACSGGELNARVGSLARYEKNNRKAEPQPAFLKVEPRATRPDSCPLPVANPQLQQPQPGVLHFSVANLDAGSIPNAPISIPNRGASSPIACRPYVDRSRRYIDGGWRIITRAARYRGSKQCTHC
jgi:hypothetical protein